MSLQIRDLTVKLKVILHIFMGNAQTVKRTVNGIVPVVLRTVQLSIKNIRKSIFFKLKLVIVTIIKAK